GRGSPPRCAGRRGPRRGGAVGGAAVGGAANGRPWGEPAPGVKREGINERRAKLGPGGGERRGPGLQTRRRPASPVSARARAWWRGGGRRGAAERGAPG
ncbi:unnamed protein product, partial [Bubo scandiacus]